MKRKRQNTGKKKLRKVLRDKSLISDYMAGMSTSQISKKYRLNREYCRQIIVRNTKRKYRTIKRQVAQKKNEDRNSNRLINLIVLCKKLKRLASYKEANKYSVSWKTYKQLKPKLIELGFKTNTQAKKEILLNDLKKLAISLNKIPSAKDINTSSDHWASDYQHYFGKLKNAQQLIWKSKP